LPVVPLKPDGTAIESQPTKKATPAANLKKSTPKQQFKSHIYCPKALDEGFASLVAALEAQLGMPV
jgi:hypothetical protein